MTTAIKSETLLIGTISTAVLGNIKSVYLKTFIYIWKALTDCKINIIFQAPYNKLVWWASPWSSKNKTVTDYSGTETLRAEESCLPAKMKHPWLLWKHSLISFCSFYLFIFFSAAHKASLCVSPVVYCVTACVVSIEMCWVVGVGSFTLLPLKRLICRLVSDQQAEQFFSQAGEYMRLYVRLVLLFKQDQLQQCKTLILH